MEWKAFWNDSPQVRETDFARQVGRTFEKTSYSDRDFEILVRRIVCFLNPTPDKTLLDLGCGNGLVTSRLAAYFKHITAVDFSRPLVAVARRHFNAANVEYVVGDAVEIDVVSGPYDCALVGATLQHFNRRQARRMLERLASVIKPGGRIVFTDVPDADRIWNFYRGIKGRGRYWIDSIRRTPIIGVWWKPSALRQMAEARGWTLAIHYQPEDCPNHYFRYDAVLQTSIRVPGGYRTHDKGISL